MGNERNAFSIWNWIQPNSGVFDSIDCRLDSRQREGIEHCFPRIHDLLQNVRPALTLSQLSDTGSPYCAPLQIVYYWGLGPGAQEFRTLIGLARLGRALCRAHASPSAGSSRENCHQPRRAAPRGTTMISQTTCLDGAKVIDTDRAQEENPLAW